MDDAVKAYEAALRLLGAGCRPAVANYGEVLVIAKDGLVSAEAQARLREGASSSMPARPRRASISPAPPSRTGRSRRQRRAYTALLSASPRRCAVGADAVKQELARPRRAAAEPRQGATSAIGPRRSPAWWQASRAAWKRRAAAPDEWARLMRSYAVLGQRDKAVGRSPGAPGRPWRRTRRLEDHRHDGPGTETDRRTAMTRKQRRLSLIGVARMCPRARARARALRHERHHRVLQLAGGHRRPRTCSPARASVSAGSSRKAPCSAAPISRSPSR